MTIPAQLKELARSPDLYIQSEKIGNKFNLHIDQIGELDAEIRDVLGGYSKSSDFIKHIMERLEIDRITADKITEEVNKEVFSSIREQLQKMQDETIGESDGIADEKITSKTQQDQVKNQQSIADLERIGGFSIEPTPNQNGNGTMPANLPRAEDVVESHDELISGIENPPPMRLSNRMPVKPSVATPEESHTDILVDHLLANPVAAAEQKISKTVEPPADLPGEEPLDDQVREKPMPIAQPLEKHFGPDLYKEPIN